jgi:segregation and condensation protein A
LKPQVVHEIRKINVTIDEQIQFILSKVMEKGEIHFLSIVHGMKEKIRIVITFVALLELAKMEKIGIRESPDFNDFVIYGIANG